MRASIFVPIFALAAFAQEESAASSAASSAAEVTSAAEVPSFTGDAFPQTSFLKQTDSRGVVTGQPAAETSIPQQPAGDSSQPALATSVGEAASIPAVGTGVHTIPVGGPDNSTRTLVVSANNSTTVILNTSGSEATGSGASGSGSKSAKTTGTKTGDEATGSGASGASGTGKPESTGAAANVRAVAGGLVGAGAFVAAFL